MKSMSRSDEADHRFRDAGFFDLFFANYFLVHK